MHRALWIARKNYLCTIMKQVSDLQGGDDIEFLRQVCRETIEDNQDDKIEGVIAVYEEILSNLTRLHRVK